MNVRSVFAGLLCSTLALANPVLALEPAPVEITRELDVNLNTAWSSWATEAGAEQFLAKDAIIDPRIDGEYSVLFFPDNPPGSRGAERMRIIAIEPTARLMFTWNSPRFFGPVREQRSIVELRFEEISPGTTRLVLRHFGWGTGGEWPRIQKYFDGAWRTVLDRLEYSYEHGAIDWEHVPPDLVYSVGPEDL